MFSHRSCSDSAVIGIDSFRFLFLCFPGRFFVLEHIGLGLGELGVLWFRLHFFDYAFHTDVLSESGHRAGFTEAS